MKPRIIVISGQQGSGKSTLALGLSQALPGNVVRLKFADCLYAMQEAIRPIAKHYCIPFDEKEGRLLQLIGTDWGRTVKGEDVWVNAAITAAGKAISAGADTIIFDDCRFPNEADAFASSALLVRLEAPIDVRESRTNAFRTIPHISETALDDYEDWDMRVNTANLSSAETLRTVLDAYNASSVDVLLSVAL